MANPRSKRQRKRRSATFSPAELEWLTGEAQAGANKFWKLKHPLFQSEGAEYRGELVDRAEGTGIVSSARAEELRAQIAEALKRA